MDVKKFSGVYPAVITPFDAEGEVDVAKLENYINYLSDKVDGLFVGGSYGSGPIMTVAQRKLLAEVTIKTCAGRIPVIMPRRQKVLDEVASWFGDCYKDIEIAAVCNFSTNAAMLVRAGLGYALTVEGGLPFLERSEVTMVPLFPELSATCVLARKRQQHISIGHNIPFAI